MSLTIVTCTAGLHHLPYDKQERFLTTLSRVLKPEGVAIIGDPYIPDYTERWERKVGATKLGCAFIESAIMMNARIPVIKAAIDVMYNDIFGCEYKTSVAKIRPMFKRHFRIVEERFTWKPESGRDYGDCLFVLKKK
ncbi:MAG TPA: class I SAM-dependent methyltransferase [Candidatus Nanoarchaeia archaeon]|nr:class I SAM-dependent methyltransferase [Candidatus Nanoarchaeia archaeon]